MFSKGPRIPKPPCTPSPPKAPRRPRPPGPGDRSPGPDPREIVRKIVEKTRKPKKM